VRIVVLRALGLGDLLTAVPAMRALRDAYPSAHITIACPRWLHDLVRLWHLADEPAAVEPLERLPARLRRAELAVNLHGCGPKSTRLLKATDPDRLIAFRHVAIPSTVAMPEWRAHEPERERWCRLLRANGIPACASQFRLGPPVTAASRSSADATILHAGASAPARRWPPRRWAAVARHERSQGRRVLLTGASDERDTCLQIADRAGIPPEDVVAGRTPLVELAALVGGAALVVSGDTGVAHLATAFATPSVVLFGPVPPAEWGPPDDTRDRNRALWTGRRGDPHATVTDAGLLAIDAARVIDEMDEARRQMSR
jgi:ADP-heptose:LPS heptosyltransferase